MKNGDRVCFLSDYDFWAGEVLYVGKKIKIKVTYPTYHKELIVRINPEKVCLENESICVVWETWRGVNGRGGYRIEKLRYPANHKIATKWLNRGQSVSVGYITENKE